MSANSSAMEEASPAVLYCYKCGRRVGADAKNCYYCGAPKHRVIRESRRCPFCDLPVRRKAVKCHNCGEYLDGRPQAQAQQTIQPQAPQQPQQPQIAYYIDKAIIGMPGGAPGTPGQPYPAGAQFVAGPGLPPGAQGNAPGAYALPHAAPQALEAPQARMIGYEGNRSQGSGGRGQGTGNRGQGAGGGDQGTGMGQGEIGAYSNDAPTVLDASAQALPVLAGGMRPGADVPAVASYPLSPVGFPSQAAQGAAGEQFYAVGKAAPMQGPASSAPAPEPSRKKKSKKKAEEEDILEGEFVDEAEAANWTTCSKCGTEISKDDNFCFHCGLPQSKASAANADARGQKNGSHLWLFLTLLCAGGCGWFFTQQRYGVTWLCAGLGAFLGLTGVFRGRGLLGRMLCLILVAGFAAYLYFTISQL